MSLQLHLHPPIMTRGQGTQEEPDEFPYLNVEFLYLIKRAATPSFHSNLPRNKEREEHILRLLLLKTTTCPSRTLLDPTCRYYFAYYSSSRMHKVGIEVMPQAVDEVPLPISEVRAWCAFAHQRHHPSPL